MSRRLRPWIWLGLLALAITGFARLRFDAEVLNLLPSQLPAVHGLKIYQEHFANARELVITVKADSPENAEAAARGIAEHLRNRTNLVSTVTWQPPWLEHPGQAAELIAYLWLNQSPTEFSQLTNRFTPDALASAFTTAREQLATSMSPGDIARLSYDPLGLTQLPEAASGAAPSFGEGQELFSSADGTFRVLFVHAARELTSYRENLSWFEELKTEAHRAKAEQELAESVQIGFTGGPAFVSEISASMESDLTRSVGGATIVIVILFIIVHRRIKPLLWLLTLLALILGGTLAVGGLFLGTVNVVSIGFAAILLGLCADSAMVLYQESRHAPHLDVSSVRRLVGPSIAWSAFTTCGAFLALNLGGLPGLAQLGTLVAIGIVLGAIIMLALFLPPLRPDQPDKTVEQPPHPAPDLQPPGALARSKLTWSMTGVIVAAAVVVLLIKPPQLDYSTNSLRPRSSPAYVEMEKIQANLSRSESSDWILTAANDPLQLRQTLQQVDGILREAQSGGAIQNYSLPLALIPNPAAHQANRSTAEFLAAHSEPVRNAARLAGFTPAATAFTETVLESWNNAQSSDSYHMPTNELSQWIFNKVISRNGTNWYALGLVQSKSRHTNSTVTWESDLSSKGVWVAGWERLGSDLLKLVRRDLWRVMLPLGILLVLSLYLAYRRLTELLLNLAALTFSGLCLLAVMGLLGWSWNLLNMLAIPLMLGCGVDYGIHMQLGLRRHRGNVRETRRTTGRALMLCAGTTVAGFGSNAWSSNLGLASLGMVCAAGVTIAFCTATFLLPAWWRTFSKAPGLTETPAIEKPSSLYSATTWRLGLRLVRIIPRPICILAGRIAAQLYFLMAPARAEIVIQNLLPAVNGSRSLAANKARALLGNFAVKLVDLWRYEAGMPVDRLLGAGTGWEHFRRAQESGRGVLLLTPHLGNWEFGGPWMKHQNVKLLVLTLAEPGSGFTELRQASRARWNIETLVVGNDPFGFLEIIKRLEAGATVALLVDRPPAATAVGVELFGQPFAASIAPAELARASGCVLLPVYIPFEDGGYSAHILPPVEYDRASLRDRQNRQKLSQQIMRIFEPAIRQHIDQWFHFIPIWPSKPR